MLLSRQLFSPLDGFLSIAITSNIQSNLRWLWALRDYTSAKNGLGGGYIFKKMTKQQEKHMVGIFSYAEVLTRLQIILYA